MEQQLWRETQSNLNTTTTTTTTNPPSLQTLSSLHSLIINPSTSPHTLSSILTTLTHHLTHHPHHPHHHILSLLTTLSHHHPTFTTTITTTLLPLATTLLSTTTSSPRLTAAVLSLLLSLSAVDSLDDSLVISLCFRPCVSVRVWFLNHALRFSIRPSLLLTVLLGFTKDPFPSVRKSALDGLVGVSSLGIVFEDSVVVEGCYFRAVQLLADQHDDVRFAAVKAVSEWGSILAASKQEDEEQRNRSDGVFLQICSMVRDMNVGVRVEAFTALGRIAFVSEYILLQTLSKKVHKTIKEKQSLAFSSKPHEIDAAIAAGAFIHGLEDEYSEVQRAACISLRMLRVVSGQFAGEAVNLLSYVLNDDSVIVRLEVLKTIHHMATSGCLKMQEAHIDMLLGTLVDSSSQIRSRAFSILGSANLPNLKVSKLTVESLLESLHLYPESEAEIFRTMFGLGQNHGNYAVSIFQDFCHEVEPSSDGKCGCSSPRIAGLLVLAISASLKHEKHLRRIPPRIFSYAAAYFGRISFALGDVLDVNSLLAYLSHCGECHLEVDSETRTPPDVLPAAKDEQEAPVHVLNAVKLTLATVKRLWPLVKCGCKSEVLAALRRCKESLWIVKAGSFAYAGAVAFAFQYIRIVKFLTKVWESLMVSRNCQLYQAGELDLFLEKLDDAILALKYRFIGFGEDIELFIMELVLLNYLLQLSSAHLHCKALQKLSMTATYMGQLSSTKSIPCSDFVNQLAKSSSNGSFSLDATRDRIQLKNLQDLFILKDLVLTQEIKHVNAKLLVLGFDSVSPLRFISGLPATIPLDITLYNVADEHRLWLKIALDEEVTEFVFLDKEEYGGVEEVRQFNFNSPFYRTPKAAAFTLRVSMGVECVFKDLHLVKGYGGPKHALTYISAEVEAYFVNMNADNHF